jgi:hypothetical protein
VSLFALVFLIFYEILFGGFPCTIGQGYSHSVMPQTIDVEVSDTFEVEVWFSFNVYQYWYFETTVKWDPQLMVLIDYQKGDESPSNYEIWVYDTSRVNEGILSMYLPTGGDPMPPRTRRCVTITFRCIGTGSSLIDLQDAELRGWLGASHVFTEDELFPGTCNQRSIIISPKSSVVGGYCMPINRLSVVSLYLVTVGIAGFLSVAYVFRRKRKP